MEFQDIRIKINKSKSIGRVVYVVEGERKEFTLLNHIFTKVFDYTFVEVKRKNNISNIEVFEKYESKININSEIYVINTKNSNISSIENGDDYLNKIFTILFEKYGLEPNKASIYYIFDRDKGSNDEKIIMELISKLKNSKDNDINPNGLLLLSYPCVESFIVSCFKEQCDKLEIKSKNIKEYLKKEKINQDQIKDANIEKSCLEMVKNIYELITYNLDMKDIDDFEEINSELFNKQEAYYDENKRYSILSLLAISFLDLGILEFE